MVKATLRLMRTAAITLAVGYVGVLALLSYFENRLVYHPVTAAQDWVTPTDEIEEAQFPSADGNSIGAWWLPCPGSQRTALYFHGNAGNLSHRLGSMKKLKNQLNCAVLILDYPGYGKSSGSPTERGCYQAADAGYDFLVNDQKRDPAKLLIHGGSLGGGVAIDLATRKPHYAVSVVGTFTSAPDVASKLFPWLPVRWLMRNQFRSIDKIASLKGPIYIAHGDRDGTIPFPQGEALFEAAKEPKQFLRLKGLDHNDPLPEEYFQKARAFFTEW